MALLDGDNQYLLAKQCCAISDVDRLEEGLAERPTASFVLDRQGHPATREDDLPVSLSATVNGTDDFVTTYEYDSEDRVVGIRQTDQDGAEVADKYVTLTYTDDGSLEQIVRYESLDTSEMVAVSEYSYDEHGRLVSLVHYQDAGDPLAEYSWAYEGGDTVEVVSDEESNALAGFSSGLDSLLTTTTETEVNDLADYVWTFDSAFTGLMIQMTTSDGVVEYSYDSRGQLTGATYDYQDDESYSYDANGNRTGDGYVVGDYNRLLSDGTYDYEYDAEGNRIKRTTTATGEVTEYLWDNRNRLVEVVDRLSEGGPIVQSVEYVYDCQNRWIAKSVDADGDGPEEAVDTYFVYDDDQIILQIDGEGEVTNRYLWGPAVDQILADEQVQEDGSTEVLWTLTDHLNTVRDLAVYDPETAVTTVANHIVYDAYGQVTSQTDPTVGTLFGFTGRAFDADTGLQNNLNRWYDAETGTWISEDPMGFSARDTNLYRYVENQSTIIVDPSGLGFLDWIQGGLDVAGTFEPTPFCDLTNAAISACRGNWVDAGCSLAGTIPYAGDAIGKSAKYGKKVVGVAVDAASAAKKADKVNEARKATKAATVGAAAAEAINKHHPWPKYLGGPAKQALEDLLESLHKQYHRGLDEVLPRNKGTAYYQGLSPEVQAKNFEKLREYTMTFDAKHGTNLWDAIKETAAAL